MALGGLQGLAFQAKLPKETTMALAIFIKIQKLAHIRIPLSARRNDLRYIFFAWFLGS